MQRALQVLLFLISENVIYFDKLSEQSDFKGKKIKHLWISLSKLKYVISIKQNTDISICYQVHSIHCNSFHEDASDDLKKSIRVC